MEHRIGRFLYRFVPGTVNLFRIMTRTTMDGDGLLGISTRSLRSTDGSAR
jgi:hypothetical protein